uniref:Clathrin/coatomer adaptor adaptin-like N-terminal domain-containing protein n=1 Tax=Salix viminalis TaxID=40686 RepID=A0A6N2KR05_SALVM
MAKIISRGDSISIYSRASSLQGFLSDAKRSEPQRVAGAVRCLGELYQHFGRKITSGLPETTIIASKLMKFHEDFVRQEALLMLEKLGRSGGSAASTAYIEAFRLITRIAIGDKSFVVRIAGAKVVCRGIWLCPSQKAIRLKYLHPDSELQQYALQVMEMLRPDTSVDAHALSGCN